MREAGVDGDTTIVLFGDNHNWFAAYALWLLEMHGVTNTRLMDGGRKKWLDEGKPTTTDVPMLTPGGIAVSERDESIRATVPDVLSHIESGGPLIDVRSPDEFNGVIMAPPGLPETAQRKGHIPGASNVPWVGRGDHHHEDIQHVTVVRMLRPQPQDRSVREPELTRRGRRRSRPCPRGWGAR